MKKKMLLIIACFCVLLNCGSLVTAATNISNERVSGGWDEKTGYFSTVSEYNKARSTAHLASSSKPVHKGKKESKEIDGTTNYRAHGWTTWTGKYHYTRARIEEWLFDTIYSDSERVWGYDSTEAISPWWPVDPNAWFIARTYYGD